MKQIKNITLKDGTTYRFSDDTARQQLMSLTGNIAAISIPGMVKIGSNINVTNDGLISINSATTTSAGIVKIGSNINVTSGGQISVNIADSNTFGLVKIGSNINVINGVINLNAATSTSIGVVKIGSNINVTNSGLISINSATTTSMGVVKIGSNINVTNGVISLDVAPTISSITNYSKNYIWNTTNLKSAIQKFSGNMCLPLSDTIIKNDGIYSLTYTETSKQIHKISLINTKNILTLTLPSTLERLWPIYVENIYAHSLFDSNGNYYLKSYQKGQYILYFKYTSTGASLIYKQPIVDKTLVKNIPIVGQTGCQYWDPNGNVTNAIQLTSYSLTLPTQYFTVNAGGYTAITWFGSGASGQINSDGSGHICVYSGGKITINSGGTAFYIWNDYNGSSIIKSGGIASNLVIQQQNNLQNFASVLIQKGGVVQALSSVVNYCNITIQSGGASISGRINWNYNGYTNIYGAMISGLFIGGDANYGQSSIKFYSGAYGSQLLVSNNNTIAISSGAKIENIMLSGDNFTYGPKLIISSGASVNKIYADYNTFIYSSTGAIMSNLYINPFSTYINGSGAAYMAKGKYPVLSGNFYGIGSTQGARGISWTNHAPPGPSQTYVGSSGILITPTLYLNTSTYVYSGGIISAGVTLGSVHISSGGLIKSTVVSSGGKLMISSGGIAKNITISSGGSVIVYNNGSICGITKITGGVLTSNTGAIVCYAFGGKNFPLTWNDITNTTNRCHTSNVYVSNDASSTYTYSSKVFRCIKVYLKAGQSYNIGLAGSGDLYLRVFDINGNSVAYDDDTRGTIDGTSCISYLTYTPTTAGYYLIGVGYYSSSSSGNITTHIYPAPENY